MNLLTNRSRSAKYDGHTEEDTSADTLTESTGYKHDTDGASDTKQDDIVCLMIFKITITKSVSKNHTQCHLTSWDVWCTYLQHHW